MEIPSIVRKKWSGLLPSSYKLRWFNVWDFKRVHKEAGLMWSIWHKVVAINAWRGVILVQID